MTAQEKVLREAIDVATANNLPFKSVFEEALLAIESVTEYAPQELLKGEMQDLLYLSENFEKDEFNAQTILTRAMSDTGNKANALDIGTEYDMFDLLGLVVQGLSFFPGLIKSNPGAFPTPSGIKSKLTTNEQKVVRSQRFQSWFGDWRKAYQTDNYDGVSKCIDKSTGEPMILYHGTSYGRDPFTTFKTTISSTPGIYLADDFQYADWFAEFNTRRGDRQAGVGSNTIVYPLFAKIMNPLDFRPLEMKQYTVKEIYDIVYVMSGYEIQEQQPLQDSEQLMQSQGQGATEPKMYIWVLIRRYPKIIQELRSNTEFDGIFFQAFNPSNIVVVDGKKSPKFGLEIIAFYANQLKHTNAIFDSGYIDDIRFERGGTID